MVSNITSVVGGITFLDAIAKLSVGILLHRFQIWVNSKQFFHENKVVFQRVIQQMTVYLI